MKILAELKRRNVFRVAALYAVLAWLILQVADVLFGVAQLPEWSLTLVAIILALGFLPVLVLAWVFQVTPDGLATQRELDERGTPALVSGRKLNIALTLLVLPVIGFLAWDTLRSGDEAVSSDRPQRAISRATDVDSIAVLPFGDFSEQQDQEHLAVGLADAILHMLAQVPDLQVAARTSSFSFRGQQVTISAIGDALGVDAVLEGSVQRAGDRLRIIAQLIRVGDETHLWSDTFDRPVGDIFAIQDEISAAVVGMVRPDQGASGAPLPASERTSVAAYEHFVRGDSLWRERTRQSIEDAIDEFRAAIAADPAYAPGHAGLAMAYLFSTYYGDRTSGDVRLIAKESIERALDLDPELALAWAARGQFHIAMQNHAEAADSLRRAVQLNPSAASVRSWLTYYSTDENEAAEQIRAAFELDPRNEFVRGSYGIHLASLGRADEALAVARESTDLDPDAALPWQNLARIQAVLGRIDEAIRARVAQTRVDSASPTPYFSVAESYRQLGDLATAEAWWARGLDRAPRERQPLDWYLVDQRRGRLLEAARANRDASPDDLAMRHDLCLALALAATWQEALDTCRALTEDVDLQNPGPSAWIAQSLALATLWAARQAGDAEVEGEMQAVLRRFVAGRYARLGLLGEFPYMEALVSAQLAAVEGRRDDVIEGVQQAVAEGYLELELLALAPWWDGYRDDPRFQAALRTIEERRAEMLASLAADPP